MTSPTFPLGQSVTLLVRTVAGRDGDGNDVYSSAPKPLLGVPVWQESSSELIQGQDTVITRTLALLPPGTDVSAIDGLQWNGSTYEVDGKPSVFQSPFTGLDPGVLVQLEEVGG